MRHDKNENISYIPSIEKTFEKLTENLSSINIEKIMEMFANLTDSEKESCSKLVSKNCEVGMVVKGFDFKAASEKQKT